MDSGRCPCGASHPTPAEQERCVQRLAFHEAGHAVVFCLVFADQCRRRGTRPPGLALGPGLVAPGSPGKKTDPWQEALVWFGGGAAEDLLFGERLQPAPESLGDWRRAERCLRAIGRYELAKDAFLVVRDLLDHHRPALLAVAGALASTGELSGEQVWKLVEENPPRHR